MASPGEIAAAQAYEDLFVPALFGAWAPRVVAAAGIDPGRRVLDVACGTGVLTRAAAERTGRDGRVVGLDAGAGMLAVAERQASATESPAVEWHQGTAEALPFGDGSFDVVVSQFGLMFFDRPQALAEMRRVLATGGRIALAAWDVLDHIPVYQAAVDLFARLGGAAAADALRAPFVIGREMLAAEVGAAGFETVVVETETGPGRFRSVRTMVEADLRGWLPVMGVHLDEERIVAILDTAEKELAPWVSATGEVEFDIPAHIVSATRP